MISTAGISGASSKAAQLLMPPTALAGCIFAGIVRDTRGVELSDFDRFNHFPASPLIALTIVFEGEVRVVEGPVDPAAARLVVPVPHISISGAQTRPVTSWSAGSIFVLTLGIFPDAWMKLTGQSPDEMIDQSNLEVPEVILAALAKCLELTEPAQIWDALTEDFLPLWQEAQTQGGLASWLGKDRLSNWSKSLLSRIALAQTGKSLRAAERALRRWSGQNQRSLEFYAKLEELHRVSQQEQGAPLAGIAQDAGFADQSHMGRSVRRATGFSPAELNRQIATQEAFWCYRLLAERF